jgi:hypothetical protein
MKRIVFILSILTICITSFSQISNVDNINVRKEISLRKSKIDSVKNDTTGLSGRVKSIMTADAIYKFVLGRSKRFGLDDTLLTGSRFVKLNGYPFAIQGNASTTTFLPSGSLQFGQAVTLRPNPEEETIQVNQFGNDTTGGYVRAKGFRFYGYAYQGGGVYIIGKSQSEIYSAQNDFLNLKAQTVISLEAPFIAINQLTKFNLGGAMPLEFFGSGNGAFPNILRLWNNDSAYTSPLGTNGVAIAFAANKENSTTKTDFARIGMIVTDTFSATPKGSLVFYTRNNGSLAERMRIDHNGDIFLNKWVGISPNKMLIITSSGKVDTASISGGGGGGGGSGTVDAGTQYRMAIYTTTGTTVSQAAAITAARVLISDANGVPIHSSTSTAELAYLNGVTSPIQNQLDGKQAQLSGTGFVKVSGTTVSYDNSTYLTTNQTITLSGNITGSGTTAIATTISNGVVTNAMLAGSIDLTAKVANILPPANGGSGNAFTGFTGPSGSVKTYTLPNSSTTILTAANLVTGPQGGTNSAFVEFAGASGTVKTYTLPNASTTILTAANVVSVSQGGTGVSSLTAYAIVCGGTNTTNPTQQVSGVGLSGQILTSQGAGQLPIWATPGSGVTLVGAINSQTKSANGAVISGSSIFFQTADHTRPGLMSSANWDRLDSNSYIVTPVTGTQLAYQISIDSIRIKSLVAGSNITITPNGDSTVTITASASSGWGTSGNTVTSGTQAGFFLGSTNNTSLRFRTNNLERAVIDSNGRFGIGTKFPSVLFHLTNNISDVPTGTADAIGFVGMGTNSYGLEQLGSGTFSGTIVTSTNASGVPFFQLFNSANNKNWTFTLNTDNTFSIREGGAGGSSRLQLGVGGTLALGTTAVSNVGFNFTPSPGGSSSFGLYGRPNLTPSAGGIAYGYDFGANITEAGSGTHSVLASAVFTPPTVTAGAASVTNAYTVLIGGAPTVSGAINYALAVTGASLFETATFTKQVSFGATQTLTPGATTTWNMASGTIAKVTLNQNTTLAISNPVAGTYCTFEVIQDGTGSRTMALPAGSLVAGGGSGAITLTTTANAKDVLTVWYDGTNYFWNYNKNYN